MSTRLTIFTNDHLMQNRSQLFREIIHQIKLFKIDFVESIQPIRFDAKHQATVHHVIDKRTLQENGYLPQSLSHAVYFG
jgi:hypothetical protein